MPPPLFVAVATRLVIVLRFDGSLCPPRDPVPGFTYLHDFFRGDSTEKPLLDGGEKLASCSATISISSQYNGGREERTIGIGGRFLPNTPHMTSATSEYEGMLLGLDWLERSFSSVFMFNKLSDPMDLVYDTKLIIRGDCKLVINQLNSHSVSRKMEPHYNRAMTGIERIRSLYAEYHRRTMCEHWGTPDISLSPSLNVCFEHVPRKDNYLCDALCKMIINQKQLGSVESIQELILLGENDATYGSKDGPNINTFRRRRNTFSVQPTSVYLKQALDEIRYNPQLCHSSRLALACMLTSASIRKKDVAILSDISGFFLDMSRRWSKIYYKQNDHDAVGSDTLRKVSMRCKELSNHFSKVTLEDGELRCSEIKSIFDFCTNSNSNNFDEGDDVLTTSAVLYPYADVFDIVKIGENENHIDELLRFNVNIVRQRGSPGIIANDMWMEIPQSR
ncbi:hypothetical protein ACHAXA_010921 [Cyclostephanos tholiformis]|uniref:Uncharacterized protein n=1 Tax=Cyclostephanos tholiformis TaxID=382380 RepID=A0ABD3RBA3_9STRA